MPDTLTAKDHKDLGKQTKDILSALSGGAWVSVYDLEKISGSRRVGARVYDLKQRGYSISSRRIPKTRTWEYRLSGPAQGILV